MNMAEYRQAVATHFDSAISDLHVYTHGGEFREEAVRRYARQNPAIIIGISNCSTKKDVMDGIIVTVTVAAVVLTTDAPNDPADARALRYATLVLREVAENGQRWSLETTDNLSAPVNIEGRNLYSEKLDSQRISLFGITWTQNVDMKDDTEAYDDFDTFHADYDLGPDPDGEIEAEDTVDLT